jgi:ATP-dependent HslUV protease subunit HslV
MRNPRRARCWTTPTAARDIVKKSLEIAGELCIYTNMHHTIETLD